MGQETGECELCGGMYWFHTRCRVGPFPLWRRIIGESALVVAGAWQLRHRQAPAPSIPSLNEPPQRGQCSTEVIKFRFTGVGLLHEPETLRAQVSSLMKVQRAGADEGSDAEGLRNGARLATPPYPSNSARPSSAISSPKVLGRRCVRGLTW